MSDGTTCPPKGSGRKSTLVGLFTTVALAALTAYGLNTLARHVFALDGMVAEGVRLGITLAVIIVAITLLRAYRRRPVAQLKGDH